VTFLFTGLSFLGLELASEATVSPGRDPEIRVGSATEFELSSILQHAARNVKLGSEEAPLSRSRVANWLPAGGGSEPLGSRLRCGCRLERIAGEQPRMASWRLTKNRPTSAMGMSPPGRYQCQTLL
jgi:hypothetical protein